MKYDLKNNKYFRWGVTAFLTIAASICFYYLLFHGSSIKTGFHTIIGILMPVVFGLVTAYLLMYSEDCEELKKGHVARLAK